MARRRGRRSAGRDVVTGATLQSQSDGAQRLHAWLSDQYEPVTIRQVLKWDRRLRWRTCFDRIEALRDAGLALEVGRDPDGQTLWVAMDGWS